MDNKRNSENFEIESSFRWKLPVMFAFGVVFVVVMLVVAIIQPNPTPFSKLVFGLVAALAAGGIAIFIPGAITVDLPIGAKAGGAIGVTALVFFAFWKGIPDHTSDHFHFPSIIETGWIFVGYVDKNTGSFTEGPYVRLIDSNRKLREKYVEIGDKIALNVARELIIADYKNGGGEPMVSPTLILGGAIRPVDRTGIKLPKDSHWVVRDVALAGFATSASAANWIRISEIPE